MWDLWMYIRGVSLESSPTLSSFAFPQEEMGANLNTRTLRGILSVLHSEELFEEEIEKMAKSSKRETPSPEELADFRSQVLGTLLHESVKTGKLDQLHRLVDVFSAPLDFRLQPKSSRFQSENVSQNQKGLSLLESAVLAPSRVAPNCVKFLAKNDFFSEEDKKNAVTLSVTGARSQFLEALIESGVPVNFISDVHQNSPLLLAALRSDGKSLKILIDAGADVLHVSESGANAVMKILSRDSGEDPLVAENLEILIKSGANFVDPDKHGDSPLIKAVRQRCHLCMKILLKHIQTQQKYDTISHLNHQGRSVLEECVSNADPVALSILLEEREKGGGGLKIKQVEAQTSTIFSYLVESQKSIHALQSADKISFSFPSASTPLKTPKEIRKDEQRTVCQMLLKEGADPKVKDGKGKTVLHYPLPLCCVDLLVDAGAPLREEDNDGMNPIEAALKRGDNRFIQLWIQKNWINERDQTALQNFRTKQGETYLHIWAGLWEFSEEFPALLKAGIPVNLTCQKGTTALERAISNDVYPAVEALLPTANISKKHIKTATDNLAIKSIGLLLQHPESYEELKKENLPSLHNSTGENLLHMAVDVDAWEAIPILVELGVDVNYFPPNLTEWDDGGTPLHSAAMKGRLSCVKELLKSGAEIDSQNTYYKNTPMHLCCEHSSPSCLKELLAKGANQNLKNANEETPKDLAQMGVDGECFKILTEIK